MGSVKIDTEKSAYALEQQFDLTKTSGVRKLLMRYHRIDAKRLDGDIDCATLITTFLQSYKNAGLTQREIDVIYQRYGRQMSTRETALKLGITHQRVTQIEEGAIEKIAAECGRGGR